MLGYRNAYVTIMQTAPGETFVVVTANNSSDPRNRSAARVFIDPKRKRFHGPKAFQQAQKWANDIGDKLLSSGAARAVWIEQD